MVATDVYACACNAKSPQERIDAADHIFIAKVEAMEGEWPEETILHLKDVYPLIGTGGKTLTVDNGNCPATITKNHIYMFYAKEKDGKITTDICMGIRKVPLFPKELCLIDQKRGVSNDCEQL